MSSGTSRRASPKVYRRRRLVLVWGILLIALSVWLLVAQPWRGWAADFAALVSPSPTPTVSSTPTAVPTDEATPEPEEDEEAAAEEAAAEEDGETPTPEATPAVEPCSRTVLKVDAVTDQDTYAAGQNPQLSITLTNTADVPCTLNVGTTSQVFTISSGNDTWWRSTDCQTEPSDMEVTLAAGQTVSSAQPVTWDRTRSEVGTCDSTSRPVAPAGGASYHLRVEIAGVSSDATKQFLLY